MDEQTKQGLGVALNEAMLFGIDLDFERRLAAVTLRVLTLPDDESPPPSDSRILIVLENVGRVAASLREGDRDEAYGEVIPFGPSQMMERVRAFDCQPIYGWEFFDLDEDFANWKEHLSLDEQLPDGSMRHSMTVFQEERDRNLDVRIWFESLNILSPQHEPLAIEDVIAGGQRWWEALHAGDPRTGGEGIMRIPIDGD